jgi:hypothetical protein
LKRPLPASSHNQYLLTIIDEYSRFLQQKVNKWTVYTNLAIITWCCAFEETSTQKYVLHLKKLTQIIPTFRCPMDEITVSNRYLAPFGEASWRQSHKQSPEPEQRILIPEEHTILNTAQSPISYGSPENITDTQVNKLDPQSIYMIITVLWWGECSVIELMLVTFRH